MQRKLKDTICAIVAFLLVVYIIFIFDFLGRSSIAKNGEVCKKILVEICLKDSVSYLTSSQVCSYLSRFNGLNPIGKNMSKISTRMIENVLRKHKSIKKVMVYKTVGSILKIRVQQRVPVLRVMFGHLDYCVDDEGKIMPVPNGLATYLPVVTGDINEKYARERLCSFAIFLKKNAFWRAQIDQIYVYPNLEIELVPHVGHHRILFGRIDHFEEKLNNLELFYNRCLNTIGWNRYSVINLKYNNQIICTKIN